MPEFLKSKVGMFLAGIYLLLVLCTILEANTSPPHAMSGLAMLILTAPCSFLLLLLFDSLGITSKEYDPLLYLYVAFGGLFNALTLYLLGCLATKVLKFLSSSGKER